MVVMASERPAQKRVLRRRALLFAASTAMTIVWCASMPVTGEMQMPGGWTMSMAWMRMESRMFDGRQCT